jgi:hypothetical protein
MKSVLHCIWPLIISVRDYEKQDDEQQDLEVAKVYQLQVVEAGTRVP